MVDYQQADRPLTVDTPLGKDALFIRGFSGHEGISQLFQFQLDLVAKNTTDVAFDKLLGQKVTVHLSMPKGVKRHFNGLCVQISQGERDARDSMFTTYSMAIVPDLWRLTRKAQSRIFQQISVPDILKKVLSGLDVTWELQGSFLTRDFCVQYRETDFNFASRLMEEEGIYYFFKHSDGSHKIVVANTPQSHSDVPGPTQIIYEDVLEGTRDEDRIYDWAKTQAWRSGKYTLWDHSFELPHKHLEAEKTIQDSVTLGKVSHKLKLAGNDAFELYDFPGEYAQRFDGVDPGGGDRAGDVGNIFQDNKRTVEIRMQEEALGSLLVHGASNCRHFASGHKFSVQRHYSGEGGPYVLTGVTHTARGSGDYKAGQTGEFSYHNDFTCIPLGLPFRPSRMTPKPVVHGTQSAVVVGPAGEDIFTDKYGRVKVQFHWDREGKNDSKSSCWIRVATLWAGKQWGMIHIPRIGQEVVVDFLEGDPDQPIIVGSVYNADMMPPYNLPANKTQSGVQSRSSLGGGAANFNEIKFEDKKGSELVTIHAERNQSISVEVDESHSVGHDRTKSIAHDETTKVGNNRTETVGVNEMITIGSNRTEQVGSNETITIGINRAETVGVNEAITIGAAQAITVGAVRAVTVGGAQVYMFGGSVTTKIGGDCSTQIDGKDTETVAGDRTTQLQANRTTEVGGDDGLSVSKRLTIDAGDEIVLKTGAASIVMKKSGDVEIKGTNVKVQGSAKIENEAAMITSEASAIHTIKGNLVKIN